MNIPNTKFSNNNLIKNLTKKLDLNQVIKGQSNNIICSNNKNDIKISTNNYKNSSISNQSISSAQKSSNSNIKIMIQ
jgi:hypothetical protein